MSDDVLFTADDIAEMRAMNEANLPHAVALRHGTRTAVGGGKFATTWDDDPLWTEPARLSPVGAPQEQMAAGSFTEFRVGKLVTREGVSVPQDTSSDVYRLEYAHDVAGVANPLMLALRGTPLRTYRMQSAFVVTW